MYPLAIIEHSITDYTGFEGEHTIHLNKNKPTVILGLNGAGKTSLLNSIFVTITPKPFSTPDFHTVNFDSCS